MRQCVIGDRGFGIVRPYTSARATMDNALNALLAPLPGDLLLITDNLQAQADFLITHAISHSIKPQKHSAHRDCIFLSTAKSFDYWKSILTKSVWVAPLSVLSSCKTVLVTDRA